MEIVFVLVPVSLLIVVVALWAFVWSVRNDQYDDLDKEAYRILFDEVVETPGSLPIQADESKSLLQEQHRIEGSNLK
ncbi:cbb3-type cytochrome oxidase assembly protein CcoS [Pseudomonadales bacterium]|jgi:cbb3-type cytochrome oxidase maturation protein|uniref:Cbb3-type cytochrome oxidase assembly protein CcoS n=1 Tax=SAR86 cluster bacterium TaxID=2030880 RepID=A0A973A8C1_9GAMM|nr:cbb3-type cytochrome oxidase assembly protein CcoS [Pseudomonadales bacterium]NQV65624.1 cbb3-type cytochrome oxidase assembly protein CcoS [SAR86 cluster bacterium]MDA9366998.1 cbb3-type cytochrome oxidase assembly protein CcoS [Pseudomonadales bacterium]MDB4068746.1 cbb3-type cytochrome oxidase assembly protein CcoS [Pseudomonadales bacterium]MDB4151570.1 cbb3-type cytochrome oxidase assembly protein CcoS [Pseudomonadales bacterium]|tara:strand:+ start:549 stop:779 length:231 start_codon:yes stop_codon:yes gene_type:complete